jgi:hypothetical protein
MGAGTRRRPTGAGGRSCPEDQCRRIRFGAGHVAVARGALTPASSAANAALTRRNQTCLCSS